MTLGAVLVWDGYLTVVTLPTPKNSQIGKENNR